MANAFARFFLSRRTLILSITFLSAALLSAANGQTSLPDYSEQIVVTGARTPIAINRLGSASTVISREEIEQRQARYASDLLRSVPGFSVSHTGVIGSQTQVRVRGSEANHVLVLIDGVRANDPATGDEFRWEYLATGDIERIEIIRGPQSALWGSDAIGAVVNVITLEDSVDQKADVYAEAGMNNARNFGAGGALQVGAWSVKGSTESFATDGGNISRLGGERDGADFTSGSVSGRYSSAKRTFDIGLRAFDATSQTDPIDFFVTGLPVDGNEETDSDSFIANFGGSILSDNERVSYQWRANYYDSQHINFVDGVQGTSTASQRTHLGLQSDIELKTNRLSVALEHIDTDYEQRGEVIFGDPNQNQNIQVFGAIAEFQYLSSDRMSWSLSGRFDDHSDFDDSFIGKAALSYQWTNAIRLRASLGTSHKTPTFIERYGFFPDQFIGNPNLKPEMTTAYEIGLDQQLLDGTLMLEISLFAQELEDEINGFVFDTVTFLGTAENRPGVSRRSGLELATRWAISSRLNAAATYTYTDADEFEPSGNRIREIRRPRHAGNLSLSFLSDNNRLSGAINLDYGGTRDDVFFPPFPESSRTVQLKEFWLVDLSVQYRFAPNISVFVRGTNLLNENYEQVYGFQTLGRAGYVGFRAAFGNDP